MTTNLKAYFPMIKSRMEVLKEINQNAALQAVFNSWEKERQKEFLDFCTGVRGVKILYDSFFKEIANPETNPQRLEDLLSVFLGRKVKILQILPNDSVRIADESTLLITDIVVELEDGSIANVEIQKIGYAFPGERCGCYSADMLLRQYKRVKSKRRKKFSYKDIKTVYTLVLFEKSTEEFRACPDRYVHHGEVLFDTGLKVRIPQEYFLIPLDIFKRSMHNKPIKNKKEAWLSFLSFDAPERVIEIITKYPEFRPMYEDVYGICQNVERVMNMFSKELREMDRNTVQYMIEEQQEKIEEQQGKIEEQQGTIEKLKEKLRQMENSK